jgi:hypothetical protein
MSPTRTYSGRAEEGLVAQSETGEIVINIKFMVRVKNGSRAPAYVQRIDRTPVQMTTNRKLALMMGRYTAEDAVKSIQNSRCIPELVPVQVIG